MMNPITQMKVAKSTTETNKPFKAKLEGYLNDRKPTLTLGKEMAYMCYIRKLTANFS